MKNKEPLPSVLEQTGINVNSAPTTDPKVAAYVHAATAPRTRRAYQEDLARFLTWGGSVPCAAEHLAEYLAAHGESHAPATLARWAVSIGRVHTAIGLDNPARSDWVRTTLRGIRRQHGSAQRQVAPALRDELLRMVAALGNSPRDVRDCALLLLGFSGALRRSELVALTTGDVQFDQRGLTLTIRHSKTDQEGRGRSMGIPYAHGTVCPVNALRQWLNAYIFPLANEQHVPIFRPINRHGHIGSKALTGHAVAVIIKQRGAAVGLSPELYSGHSLRAGFCTTAALRGVPNWQIKKISGHRSSAILERYIRAAELFTDSPLEGMF